MSLRSWLHYFVTAGALAWSVDVVSTVDAQEPAPPAAAAPAGAPATGEVPRLPDVNVIAEPPAPPPVNLQPNFEPFSGDTVAADNTFTSPPFTGYYGGSSSTGSLIDLPQLRFPGSISVIGKDLIKDQQALRINDVIRDIGGAVQTNNDQLRPDAFLIRGLEVTSYNYRKNGFLDPTYTPRDFANVERIDVFKGPSSVLYGPADPSGTVNVVTKKALQDRFAFGGAMIGSWGLQRYVSDVNTMNRAGDVLMRVNTAYENRSGFRDNYYNNRVFVAPTVTFLLSEDTAITVEGEYLQDHRRYDTGVLAVNGNTRAFSEDIYYGTLNDFQRFQDARGQFSLIHKLSDEWQFYLGGQTLFYQMPSQGTVPSPLLTGPLPTDRVPLPDSFYAGGPLFRTQSQFQNASEQSHGLITNLSGVIETGPLVHHLAGGFEGNWQSSAGETLTQSGFAGSLLFVPGVSPYSNGTYGGGTLPTEVFASFPVYHQDRFGFYQQDLIDVTPRLKVLLSQRFDTVNTVIEKGTFANTGFGPIALQPLTRTDNTIHHWSPRAGLIYELVPGAMSAYGVYTNSFAPPTGGNVGPLPEIGSTWEGGLKTNIYEDLVLTVGGFWIERTNASVRVSDIPTVYDQSGVQRSQGVEVNLLGQWTERFSTSSNYTYNDVMNFGYGNSRDGDANGRVRGVPFNLANVWARYNVLQDRDRVLGFGLGWIYVGERRGDYNSPLVLGSYNRFDLGLFSQLKQWTLNAYIENLFDNDYDAGSISQFQVYPGAPTNFRLQAGVVF